MGGAEGGAQSNIQGNLQKLFETFTKGSLTDQGANSEIILRTVHKSLNEDFLKIIEDSDVVNKIVEVIKEKQNSIAEDNTDTTLASKTTKQVVTDTLDTKNLDIMSVVLDFMNELQNAILQVKMKLAREQDTKTLQQAKVETNAS